MQTIYMKVTKDKYELPLAVADSIVELAELIGIKADNIYSTISHARKKGYKCCYVKVEID